MFASCTIGAIIRIMWIILAFLSAFFAGITAILAKCGIKETDSTVATAFRTIVVLAFSWIMAAIGGPLPPLCSIAPMTWIFLILSGLATGASWLCYFHALKDGDVSKVVPIDKSSTVLSMLLAILLLHEPISAIGVISMILIALGTYLMIQRQDGGKGVRYGAWLLYALLSAVFAALASILGKIGIEGIDPDLGTAIRTTVVLAMAWLAVAVEGKTRLVMIPERKEMLFILLSGLATGASWLCYYRALQTGLALVVVPIDKLSIVVSIVFSRVVFHEKLGMRSLAGLLMIVLGTMLLIL